MRAVAQRVHSARVTAGDELLCEQGPGLLALVGVGHRDTVASAAELARKLVHLRIFNDADERMNRSLLDTGGTLGVVSQFTLFGDARQGRRPSFVEAARPEHAAPLVEAVVEASRRHGAHVVTGRFQTMMHVTLVNDGPVTLLLDTEKRF